MQISTKNNPTKSPQDGCDHHHDRLRISIWRFIKCDGPSGWVFAVIALVLAAVLTIHFVG